MKWKYRAGWDLGCHTQMTDRTRPKRSRVATNFQLHLIPPTDVGYRSSRSPASVCAYVFFVFVMVMNRTSRHPGEWAGSPYNLMFD